MPMVDVGWPIDNVTEKGFGEKNLKQVNFVCERDSKWGWHHPYYKWN